MIGKTLAHYRITRKLGEGGMGEVYRAHDERLGRDVAIKVLHQHLATPEMRARFEREARTVSRLSHPHICTLHDVGRDGDTDYLVMELVQGESLAARLGQGPLPVDELLPLAIQTARALACAHAAGVVHRDLKPGNLMLSESGVKLLDFGLAAPQVAAAEPGADSATRAMPLTAAGALVGTFPYMAPEQVAGQETDARTDVFAFGCVLYEMATGRRAFRGDDPASILGAILHQTPEGLRGAAGAGGGTGADSVPRALADIIERCLEKDPDKRFAGGEELADALAGVRDWPQKEGIPELARIVGNIQGLDEGPETWDAWELAREIQKLAPRDPQLAKLRAEFTHPLRVTSEPAGARVSIRAYRHPDRWFAVGTTPLELEHAPRGFVCLKLEKEGRREVHDLIFNHAYAEAFGIGPLHYPLPAPDQLPQEMEPVPAGDADLILPGLEHLETLNTAAFLLDRHPVTNRQYKAFVDAGGYGNADLWPGGMTEEDKAALTDSVGRPGPATWELGEHPSGQDDHPVTGVSWYEAAAYAKWAGKELPTLHHWNRVALTFAAAQVVPRANLAGHGTVPVGTTQSVNRFGVHDLAGNVREWVRNQATPGDQRFILGGGWNDPEYAFADAYAQPPLDRSVTNGFRCLRAVEPEPNRESLSAPIEIPFRDFSQETPVGDETFAFFRRLFLYDRTPLNAQVEAEEDGPLGRGQTVELDAAYGGERLTVYLFLPPADQAPHPVVVLFPGSGSIQLTQFQPEELKRVDFLVKSGYALALPVYKGTYHRQSDFKSDTPKATALYRDHLVMWAKDLSRTLDYLETREDIDAARTAYFGLSWGGAMGAILPAVEERIRAVLLYVAGLSFQRPFPEADAFNYLPRVKQPTLMLNGELDFFFPKETSQRPMFERLGTPEEHTRWVTTPGAHSVPRAVVVKEALGWLERYLGGGG